MTARPSPELVECPCCGAKNPADAEDCTECSESFTIFIGPTLKDRRFHLRTAMILVAVIAVCLGIARQAPWLGISLILVLVPAGVRSIQCVLGRDVGGHPMGMGDKLAAVLSSIGIMILLYTVGFLVFVVAWGPLFFMFEELEQRGGTKAGKGVAIAVGVVAASVVVFYCGKKAWHQEA